MAINYWEKLEAGVTYHIYNRANGRDNLFVKDENYSFFLEKWKKYLPYLDVYAYCLMPNHFHFLAQVKPVDSEALIAHIQSQRTVKSQAFLKGEIEYSEYLEDQFKRLFSSYALAINKQEGRHGALFQKRFKRISIINEHRLCYLLAYIHHNPIHHFFIDDFDDWKYSSWAAYANLDLPSLLNRLTPLSWFGSNLETAKSCFFKYHEDFKIDKKNERDEIDFGVDFE
jgi:REP element-mobilizing transposase RayT